jgi:glucokinase
MRRLDPPDPVLGVDVGGTKIATAWVDVTSGALVDRDEGPSLPERGSHAVLDDVASRIEARVSETPRQESAIGLAICETVDLAGRLTSAQTIDWRAIDVPGQLGRFGDVVVSSDVRAGALAEARLGTGRDLGSFLYVSVGTGISASLVIGGVPHAGARGNALVLASGPLRVTCPSCGERVEVAPEEIASGAGIARRFAALRPDAPPLRTEEVLAVAAEGDPDARHIVDEAAAMLGTIVAWAVNLVDPQTIVIGGGLGGATGAYRERFVATVRDLVWAEASRDVPMCDAVFGPDAVVIGAAIAAANGRPA